MSSFFGPSKQKSKTEPSGPAKVVMDRVLNKTNKLLGKNKLPKLNKHTTQALTGLNRVANQNIGGKGLGTLQGTINNGGFNNYQTGALDNLQKTANANYDMNANPGFGGVLKAAQDAARNQVDMSASANGRYGSGVAQGAVAREVGNVTNQMVSDDYNRFLGRQDSANQNMFNNAQAGIGNMQAAYDTMQAPLNTKLGVGQAYDQRKKEQMDNPWNNLSRGMKLAAASGYRTQTSPGPSAFSQILGGVTDAAKALF